ncbi:MAG: molybdopterin-dependent oxidoreductase [Fimbriimonas sp.]|nr:molybdopterin-dependent oxidoreductase [Fimbriimonas sp.]
MSFDPELQTADVEMSRRSLLKVLGGGILVLASVPDAFAWAMSQRGQTLPQKIGAWVHIGPDNKITVLTGKVEVGQNARTSVTQAVVEELRAPLGSVEVVMGDTDLVPYDMGTFGSRTTPTMIPQIRRAAAAAREKLTDLAAKKWGVDRTKIHLSAGKITSGIHSASYGEIAKGQPFDEPISEHVPLTPNKDWTALGHPTQKVGIRDFVTGKHEYTSDLKRPGMLYAKVLRAPSFGATLKSLDTSQAETLAGVRVVHDGDFVAVAAPTRRLAEKALAAIKSQWNEKPGPSSKEIFKLLRGDDKIASSKTPDGAKALTATYTAPYIAHVPLEPRAALAEWDGVKMTVYTGTQRPFGVRPEVATALGIPEKQVRVLVPDTGSGYGGKHSGDAAVEAAKIAKALGKPIKLVWTRVEEFTWAYFRPAGVDEIASAVNPDGKVVVWEFDNYNSGSPGIETPYAVPSPRTDAHRTESPLRQGSYRCLGATFNNFARESHMDELAHEVGMDPLDFRMKNLPADSHLRTVLQAAADRFGWGKEKPAAGHGFGIACGQEKGGSIATVVELSIDSQTKEIQLLRIVNAFECGKILNPDLLKNQVEGAVIMGIGGALFEAIEFANGQILNPHLGRYRVPRYSDIPKIETILLDRPDLGSAGAGESPILAIAPAIGNAIFSATGTRLRALPMGF